MLSCPVGWGLDQLTAAVVLGVEPEVVLAVELEVVVLGRGPVPVQVRRLVLERVLAPVLDPASET